MTQKMNRIEKLIAELCPDGVEFKSLMDVFLIKNGRKDRKNAVEEGAYRFFTRSSTPMRIDSYSFEGEAIVCPGEGNIGAIHYVNEKFDAHQRTYVLQTQDSNVSAKFVYYFMAEYWGQANSGMQSGSTVSSIRMANFSKFQIPIPPLPIQQEIVNILDTFSQLEAELEAELEARKKQYEYYRDELLTFGEEVEWKTLGEVCHIYTGGEAPPNCIKGSIPNDIYKYPIYANGYEVYGFTDSYKISKDAVTISSIGANTGTIYFRKAYFTPIIRLKVLLPKFDNLLAKYIFYYLSSIKIYSKKSSVPNMNAAEVKKIKIPIPPLAEQERIVAILDKFDALVNDISAGLPAELNARRKQYEYYRNKLLTFQQKES